MSLKRTTGSYELLTRSDVRSSNVKPPFKRGQGFYKKKEQTYENENIMGRILGSGSGRFGSKKRTKRRSAPKRTKSAKSASKKRKGSKKAKGSRRRSLSSVLKARKTRCNNLLKNKISINMKELKKGKFKNRAQAIAVSYSQVKKRYPSCAKAFKR